jgi:hypothetical protein
MEPSNHHTGLHWVEHNVRPEDKVGMYGDCVTRSIVMATGEEYETVWNALTEQKQGISKRKRGTADTGVNHFSAWKYIRTLGWKYVECPTGTKFTYDSLPSECIASIPGHYVYVKNGIVYDTYDCRGKRKRKLEGYYIKKVLNETL